jgi:hypothetical protein
MSMQRVTVELGRVAPYGDGRGDDLRGQALYLPGSGLVVAVESSHADRARCAVIAAREPSRAHGHVDLESAVLANATKVMIADPYDDVPGYAMVWKALVWLRWPGGRTASLAQVLLEHALPAGTLTFALTADVWRTTRVAAHTTAPGMAHVMTKLDRAGFLVDDTDGHDDNAQWYRLTLPKVGGPGAAR